MKVAVVYNRESQNVINLFGSPNQEKIGLKTIKRIVDALKAGGHQATSIEGDKDLIDKLEEYMPKVVKGERPGIVFNVSYGIQGKARYTHVPSILEMVGIPYVGSNPLAHSLALDKVVSKMIFKQQGVPTADFAVLDAPDAPLPEVQYPLIVKPKNEAVSFGIAICNDEAEVRTAAAHIFEKYQQPVLVEQYIEGREVNVGILGNDPPEALPPAELRFGSGGPNIYTYEDKTRKSGREIEVICPAPLSDEMSARVQDIAQRAFRALQCSDCCRVDMRINDAGEVFVLEVNSLPSMGEHGSYVEGAMRAGLDFNALVNRLVEVAAARYFGTPVAASLAPDAKDAPDRAFGLVTEQRDVLERRLREAVMVSSRTMDRVGLREMASLVDRRMRDVGLKRCDAYGDASTWAWQTSNGYENGTLLLVPLDVPLSLDTATAPFHRDPEWLYGEGIGSSRAPLVVTQMALRSAKQMRLINKLRLGVLAYGDEGDACAHSEKTIAAACSKAARVIVMRPGTADGKAVVSRRGQRIYRLTVDGKPVRVGQASPKRDVLRWTLAKLEGLADLTSRKERVSVSTLDVDARRFPTLLPHNVRAQIAVTYGNQKSADSVEQRMHILLGKEGPRWELDVDSDRPPTPKRKDNALQQMLTDVAARWELPFEVDSSVSASVAGLVPAHVPVMCGMGPSARDLHTPQESVNRLSLLQRTLLMSQLLVALGDGLS